MSSGVTATTSATAPSLEGSTSAGSESIRVDFFRRTLKAAYGTGFRHYGPARLRGIRVSGEAALPTATAGVTLASERQQRRDTLQRRAEIPDFAEEHETAGLTLPGAIARVRPRTSVSVATLSAGRRRGRRAPSVLWVTRAGQVAPVGRDAHDTATRALPSGREHGPR